MKSLPRKLIIAAGLAIIGLILAAAYFLYESAEVQRETSHIIEFKLFQQ